MGTPLGKDVRSIHAFNCSPVPMHSPWWETGMAPGLRRSVYSPMIHPSGFSTQTAMASGMAVRLIFARSHSASLQITRLWENGKEQARTALPSSDHPKTNGILISMAMRLCSPARSTNVLVSVFSKPAMCP